MRKIDKAEFAEYLETGDLTRDSIIQLGNWVIGWLKEGTTEVEVIYVEI